MKLLIALGARKPDGVTPFALMPVDDYNYQDDSFRRFLERDVLAALRDDYHGTPVRLLWVEQEGFEPPAKEFLEALADGALVPWDVLEDRTL